MVIAVVGAGGKTTRVHELARAYRNLGKTVLVTTSTHMLLETGCILGEDEKAILEAIQETGYCMAGMEAENGKISAFSEEFLEKIEKKVDIVIVEADGSRGLPVKAPRSGEPVIPKGCNRIEVVMGLSALGKPLKEVTHRIEEVMELTGLLENHILTAEDIQKIIELGYTRLLREKFPKCEVFVRAGQVNTLYDKVVARFLNEEKDVSEIKKEWFEHQPVMMILGGGHVAYEVAKMAKMLDFYTIVADDREEFVSKERFGEADERVCTEFSAIEKYFPNTENVYFVVLTRGHAADYSCVKKILDCDYQYLGMIGSKKKVAVTLEQLRQENFSEEKIQTIHAPIGLKIGARTPAEIAVSILAEMIQVKNAGSISTMTKELYESQEEGVLCIITKKKGSSPRGVGSMMLVTKDGILGTIGGGALEHEVIHHAASVTEIEWKEYDLSNRESARLGMICGGYNQVLYIPIYFSESNGYNSKEF